MVGIEFFLADSVLYDGEITDVQSHPEISIDRSGVALFFRRGLVLCRLGLLRGGEWDEDIAGPGFSFDDVRLADGAGWWGEVGLEHELFRRGPWHLDVNGRLHYLREDYTLSYGRWTTTQIIVPGTNGAPDSTRLSIDREDLAADVALTEWGLTIGGSLFYEGERWSFYGGLELIPLVDTDLDAAIATDQGAFDIKFEQTHPITAFAGTGVKLADFKVSLEGSVGEEQRVKLSILYTLP
jgi:hypothetical protein